MRPSPIACALAIAPFVAATHVARADSAAAEALFNDGKSLMTAGKIADACPKFEASFREDPLLGALLNAGDCREQQGRLATAWAHFSSAVDLATKSKDKRLDYATKRRDALTPRLPHLKISVVDPVAEVKIYRGDQELSAGTFGEDLPVDPGETVLQLTLNDEVLWEETITLDEGQHIEKTIDAKKYYDAAPSARKKRQEHKDPGNTTTQSVVSLPFFNGQRIAGLAVLITGILGAGAGFTLGGLALDKKSTIEADCATNATTGVRFCTPDGLAAANTAVDFATASQWTLVAGGAVTAIGLTLFLTAPTSKVSELEERADLGPKFRFVVPAVTATSAGLVGGGTF